MADPNHSPVTPWMGKPCHTHIPPSRGYLSFGKTIGRVVAVRDPSPVMSPTAFVTGLQCFKTRDTSSAQTAGPPWVSLRWTRGHTSARLQVFMTIITGDPMGNILNKKFDLWALFAIERL